MNIVILGAGQAAASLAAKLRALGHKGGITVIGEEPVAPYQRPPLSKAYLLGEMDQDRLTLRAPEWWAENAITLRLGERATAIDRDRRMVPVTVAAMTATTTARRSTAVIAPATSRPGATSAASPSVAKTSRRVHAGSANRRRGRRCNVRLRARVRQHR